MAETSAPVGSVRDRGSHSPVASSYWCTACNQVFTTKKAWRDHDDEHHFAPDTLRCPQPGCCRTFRDIDSFSNHLGSSNHACRVSLQSDSWTRFQGQQKHWGCGFCTALHDSREKHLEHTAVHFESGSILEDWEHSRVIYGLLKQPFIRDAWSDICSFRRLYRRNLSWNRSTTGRSEGFADYNRPGQLQDFLEYFCGIAKDAKGLADLAFDLADFPGDHKRRIQRIVAKTSQGDGRDTDEELVEPSTNLEAYVLKPSPPLPPRPTLMSNTDSGAPLSSSSFVEPKANPQAPHSPHSAMEELSISQDLLQLSLEARPLPTSSPHRPATNIRTASPILPKQRASLGASQLHRVPGVLSPQDSDRHRGSSESDCESVADSHCSEPVVKGEVATTCLVEQVEMRAVLDGALEEMLGRLMKAFWATWRQEWHVPIRQHINNSATSSASSRDNRIESNSNSPAIVSGGSRKRGRDDDDSPAEDDGGDDDDRSGQPSGRSSPQLSRETVKKLACPYRKHDPTTYSLAARRVCAISGWNSTHRLK